MFQLHLTQEETATLFEMIALDTINVGGGKVVKQYKQIPTEEAGSLIKVLQLFTDEPLFEEQREYQFKERNVCLDRDLYMSLAVEVFGRLKKSSGQAPYRWMQTLMGVAAKMTDWMEPKPFVGECSTEGCERKATETKCEDTQTGTDMPEPENVEVPQDTAPAEQA